MGGLMSYGADIMDMYFQAGVYAGRNPQRYEAHRPASRAVDQIRIRHQHADARALGLEVPTSLLAHAEEMIE